jgi:hypothetical protein
MRVCRQGKTRIEPSNQNLNGIVHALTPGSSVISPIDRAFGPVPAPAAGWTLYEEALGHVYS